MAGSVNRATILGHLGKDPDLRTIPSGKSVCNFSVATSDRYQKGGEWQEKTEWHNIVVWGKAAEYCDKFLRKGSMVYLEGKIQTRKWKDKDGNDKWTTEIMAFVVTGLDKRERGGGGGRSDEPRRHADDADEAPANSEGGDGGGGGINNNDDFPF